MTAYFFRLKTGLDQTVYFAEVQFQKDPFLYHRLFAELFLFLAQNPSTQNWCAVILYPTRSLEPDDSNLYRVLLNSSQVQRIYLDEFDLTSNSSLGVGIVQLVIAPEDVEIDRAKHLIQQANQTVAADSARRAIIEIIETIVVYKFPILSRQEIEAMLNLSELKQTRVYQEALEEGREEGRREGKLAAVPLLLQAGMTVEQIAEQLNLDLEAVRQAVQPPS